MRWVTVTRKLPQWKFRNLHSLQHTEYLSASASPPAPRARPAPPRPTRPSRSPRPPRTSSTNRAHAPQPPVYRAAHSASPPPPSNPNLYGLQHTEQHTAHTLQQGIISSLLQHTSRKSHTFHGWVTQYITAPTAHAARPSRPPAHGAQLPTLTARRAGTPANSASH